VTVIRYNGDMVTRQMPLQPQSPSVRGANQERNNAPRAGRAERPASKFRFGDGGFDMKVLELQPGKRVLWQVVDGPEEWLGTKISFDLKQNGDWTVVLFKHQGWKEPLEFMHHCSTKWAVFLLSLKSLLETGKGAPWPNEIKLDSWE
jgi:hypothetical protein